MMPVITGGSVFTARSRKSWTWPWGTSTPSSMMWPRPLMLITAARGKAGVSQLCADRFQTGIAADAVYDGVKPGVQRYRMVGGVEREVRMFVVPSTTILIELTFEVTDGREYAADALDGIQIGMVERVVARYGGSPGLSVCHGPKLPTAWISPRGMAFVSVASYCQGAFGPTSCSTICFSSNPSDPCQAWPSDDQPRVAQMISSTRILILPALPGSREPCCRISRGGMLISSPVRPARRPRALARGKSPMRPE